MRPNVLFEPFASEFGPIALQVYEQIGGAAEKDGVSGQDCGVSEFFAIMVLPSPLAPTRTTSLLDEIQCQRRSMASRSTFLGQLQSKSAMGLKLPMLARRVRTSRLRRERSRTSS